MSKLTKFALTKIAKVNLGQNKPAQNNVSPVSSWPPKLPPPPCRPPLSDHRATPPRWRLFTPSTAPPSPLPTLLIPGPHGRPRTPPNLPSSFPHTPHLPSIPPPPPLPSPTSLLFHPSHILSRPPGAPLLPSRRACCPRPSTKREWTERREGRRKRGETQKKRKRRKKKRKWDPQGTTIWTIPPVTLFGLKSTYDLPHLFPSQHQSL